MRDVVSGTSKKGGSFAFLLVLGVVRPFGTTRHPSGYGVGLASCYRPIEATAYRVYLSEVYGAASTRSPHIAHTSTVHYTTLAQVGFTLKNIDAPVRSMPIGDAACTAIKLAVKQ